MCNLYIGLLKPPNWLVEGVLVLEPGARGAGAATPPVCEAGWDNFPTGRWSHCPARQGDLPAIVDGFRGILYC